MELSRSIEFDKIANHKGEFRLFFHQIEHTLQTMFHPYIVLITQSNELSSCVYHCIRKVPNVAAS